MNLRWHFSERAALVVMALLIGLTGAVIVGWLSDGRADATFMGDKADPDGAVVYLDGHRLGVMMRKNIYDHSEPWLNAKAALGNHRLTVVSAKGETLSGTYYSHDSGEVHVSFWLHDLASK